MLKYINNHINIMKLKHFISLLLISSIFSVEEVQQINQCGNGKVTYYEVNAEGNCGFGNIFEIIDTAAAQNLIYDRNMDVEYDFKL